VHIAPAPGAGDAGSHVIRTRHAFPIPFRYVGGVFNRRTNPREFFELVYPQIVAQGRLVEMDPFVKWMCTTCTARFDQGVGQVVSAVAQASYEVPPANRVLRLHRQNF
jgi:hypothetical protein